METTDQKTIVKRIAKAWNQVKMYDGFPTDSDFQQECTEIRMVCYRYTLEMAGLTLNEIISLGDVEDLDEAIDRLFDKNVVKS